MFNNIHIAFSNKFKHHFYKNVLMHLHVAFIVPSATLAERTDNRGYSVQEISPPKCLSFFQRPKGRGAARFSPHPRPPPSQERCASWLTVGLCVCCSNRNPVSRSTRKLTWRRKRSGSTSWGWARVARWVKPAVVP